MAGSDAQLLMVGSGADPFLDDGSPEMERLQPPLNRKPLHFRHTPVYQANFNGLGSGLWLLQLKSVKTRCK